MEGFTKINLNQTPKQTALINCSISNILDNKVSKETPPNSHDDTEQDLRLGRSKLPRIVKTSSTTYPSKIISFRRRQNDSGDNKVGSSSSQSSRPPPSRDESYSDGEKLKPSQIPRRRVNSCDAPTKESCNAKKFARKPTFNTETKNVQRIHVFNTLQDFYSERPSASLGCSRPIPTLGNIYQRAGNRDTNWLIETDSNFLATLSVSIDTDPSVSAKDSAGIAEGFQSTVNSDTMNTTLPPEQPMANDQQPQKVFRVTKENVCQWSDEELEYPTRDRSRHHTNARVRSIYNSLELPIVKESERKLCIKPNQDKSLPASDPSKNNTANEVREQETVILERSRPAGPTSMGPDMTVTQTSEAEFTKSVQFPSDPNAVTGNFAVSYVDCASEVLQKTTDFETADMESSRGTFENNDYMPEEDDSMWSYSRDEDGSLLFSSSEEYNKSEQTIITKGKECDSDATVLLSSEYSHQHNYICIKRLRRSGLLNDRYYDRRSFLNRNRGRGKTEKFKERILKIPHKRLSFRRLCRRRWNYVCQKTAERWARWPKSSVKFKSFRMLYFHPEINWEDVHVQTAVTICRETGTATIMNELRSAGIATSLRLPQQKTDTATSGKSLNLSMLTNFRPPIQQPALAYTIPTLQENNSTSNHKYPSYITEINSKEINLPIYRACDSFSKRFYDNIQTGQKADDVTVPQCVSDGTQSEADKTDSQDSQMFAVESKVTVLSCADSIKRPTEDKSTHTSEIMKLSFSDKTEKSNKSASRHASCLSKSILKAKKEIPKFNKNIFNYDNNISKSSECGIVETKGGTDFSFKPNSESTKPATYLSSLYPQPPNQAIPNMVSCSAEVNSPIITKVCQTGASSSWMHFLCHRSTSMGQPMYSPNHHSAGITTTCLTTTKSVETDTENLSKFSSKTFERTTGLATMATIYPVKITKGTSGSRMDTTLRKEASTETIPPIAYLGFQGPKIISISSRILPTISTASIKCKTQSTGIPSSEVKLQDKEVHSPTHKRCRAWQLICCAGTDTTSDVGWCSKSTLVETSDLEMESERNAKSLKTSCTGGSIEIPTMNVTTKYVPAYINTESSTNCVSASINTDSVQKSVSVGTSRIFPETPVKFDFSTQPSSYKDVVRVNYSTAISCNMVPAIFVLEIATQTDKPPVLPGHDQETHTVDELASDRAIECSIDAKELIKKTIRKRENDQIAPTAKPQEDNIDQNVKDSVISVLNPSPSASHDLDPKPPPGPSPKPPPGPIPRPPLTPTPRLPLFPKPPGEACPHGGSLGITCVACFKPKISSPFLPLSKDVSKEKVNKPLTPELDTTNVDVRASAHDGSTGEESSRFSPPSKNVWNEKITLMTDKKLTSVVMRQTRTGSSDRVRSNKSLKGTVAQTALEVQDAATQPCCCGKKSENVFTSRYVLATPHPCPHGTCHHSTECLYVYEQPHCAVHRKIKDASVQMQPSRRDIVLAAMSVGERNIQSPPDAPAPHSASLINEIIGNMAPRKLHSEQTIVDNLDVTPRMTKNKSTITSEPKQFLATVRAQAPSVHSLGVRTSKGGIGIEPCEACGQTTPIAPDFESVYKQHEKEMVEVFTQTSFIVPNAENGGSPLEGYLTSCRYYGSLLSDKLNRVKENLTKRLTPSDEEIYEAYENQENCLNHAEACTMKPSGRNEFCAQADFPKRKIVKTLSCFVLGHAYSVTDFGRGHEEDNLNAVYCMLSAIEGRIRRLKRNTFTCR